MYNMGASVEVVWGIGYGGVRVRYDKKGKTLDKKK